MAVAIGLVIAPRRLYRAWKDAAGARSLYRDPRPLEELLEMRIGDLREQLGIPREGLAPRERATAAA